MPVQGVNNQIFELLFSRDKKIQDFIKLLKPGDMLNGKVIDVFLNENKALINFKGYNLISQIPQNINIQKGDTINVIVYNINDKIYMKLNNLTNNNIISPLNNTLISEEILNVLNSLKIPINEHNLFVAQNLIKYQLPVNKENINDINNSLTRYLQEKGIDIKIFNLQNSSVAKEIIFSNLIKFNNEINQLYNNQNLIYDKSISSKVFERLSNLINTANELNKYIPEQKIFIDENSLILKFDNINQSKINDIINILSKQGVDIKQQQISENISFNNINLIKDDNTVIIKFENLINNLKTISDNINKFGNSQIFNKFNEIITNLNTFDTPKQILTNLNPVLLNLKNIYDDINNNVYQPNNTKLNDNIKQIFSLLNTFKNELDNVKSNNIINNNDLNKIYDLLNKSINTINNSLGENKLNPKNFINIQNSVKNFLDEVNNILNFKNTDNKINIPPPSSIKIDIESIIEALIFLKTKNININNDKFIDIMSKFFSNDMKLSNNIDKLNLYINDFLNAINNDKTTKNNFIKIIDIINNIKNNLNEISIKPDNNNLKPEILLTQIKNFIEKSGLNVENNIKNILLQEIDNNTSSIKNLSGHTLDKNLKSLLIKFNNELDSINTSNFNNNIRKIISDLKETSNDILNNLNAIQLINQKQSAIDLIYTQIPVFFNTKFFNGELQIWYRKDSPKQELGKLTPVNLLFIINTSNLGQVKLYITIFKNQIDCIIKTANENVKQILTRGKNEFINKLSELNYKINNFNIKLEDISNDDLNNNQNNQYIKLSNINLRA